MIQYILDVTLTWFFLYLIFYTFLRKETFFSVNRYYLVSAITLGIVLPLLRHLHIDLRATDVPEMAPLVTFIHESPAVISQSFEQVRHTPFIDLYQILTLIYVLGFSFFFVRLIKGLTDIYSIYKNGDIEQKGDHILVHSYSDHLPFSFLNAVFISKSVPLKEEYHEVITHELEHVKSRHSLDVLYMEMVNVFFWFNPMIYLYKSAIKQTHEYLADAAVLHQTDKKMYGHILLRQSLSGIQIALAHSFFHSHIKKRIKMMYQKKSGRWAGLKYLLVLPLLALMITAFSVEEEEPKGFTSIEFGEEIYFHCNGKEGSVSPVEFFKSDKEIGFNPSSNADFILTDNIKKLANNYDPENNLVFVLDNRVLLEDEVEKLDFENGFKADVLTIYSPEYAIEKYGEVAKFGAVRIDGLEGAIDARLPELVIYNGWKFKRTDGLSLAFLDEENMISLKQVKHKNVEKLYGEDGKRGVIIVQTELPDYSENYIKSHLKEKGITELEHVEEYVIHDLKSIPFALPRNHSRLDTIILMSTESSPNRKDGFILEMGSNVEVKDLMIDHLREGVDYKKVDRDNIRLMRTFYLKIKGESIFEDPFKNLDSILKIKNPLLPKGYTVLTAFDGKKPTTQLGYFNLVENYRYHELIVGKQEVKDFILLNEPGRLTNWHDTEEALINFSKVPFEGQISKRFKNPESIDNSTTVIRIDDEKFDSTDPIQRHLKNYNRGFGLNSHKSVIYLGLLDIPENVLKVSVDHKELTQGKDYRIDYKLGNLWILNKNLIKEEKLIQVYYKDYKEEDGLIVSFESHESNVLILENFKPTYLTHEELIKKYDSRAYRYGNQEVLEYLLTKKVKLPKAKSAKKLTVLRNYYNSPYLGEIDKELGTIRLINSEKGKAIVEYVSDIKGKILVYSQEGYSRISQQIYKKLDKSFKVTLLEEDLPKTGFQIVLEIESFRKLYESPILRFKDGFLVSDKKAQKQWNNKIIKPYNDESLKADNSQKRLTSIHYVKHLYFDNPFSLEDMDLSKERVHKKEGKQLRLGPVFENFYAKNGLKKTFLWMVNGKKIKDFESFPLQFDETYVIGNQEIYSPTLGKKTFGNEGKHGAVVMTGVEIADLNENEKFETTVIYDPETFEQRVVKNPILEEDSKDEKVPEPEGLFTRMKNGVMDYFGINPQFRISCDLEGLDYSVRHGEKDQLAFTFESKIDAGVDIYFDDGNDIVTKPFSVQKGTNKVAFSSNELPQNPFVIKLGSEEVECYCTFGVLHFDQTRRKFQIVQSVNEWEKEQREKVQISHFDENPNKRIVILEEGRLPKNATLELRGELRRKYNGIEIIEGYKDVNNYLGRKDIKISKPNMEYLFNYFRSDALSETMTKHHDIRILGIDNNELKIEYKSKKADGVLFKITELGQSWSELYRENIITPHRSILISKNIDGIEDKKFVIHFYPEGQNGGFDSQLFMIRNGQLMQEGSLELATEVKSQKPLLVVNGKKYKHFDQINDLEPGDIDHINVFKADEALGKYGEEGQHGVVEVFTKKKISLLEIDQNGKAQPLFVLDGQILPKKKQVIENIDPNDIAKINVLKGEKALKKYGDQGADGVVEITTKKPSKYQNKLDGIDEKEMESKTLLVVETETYEKDELIHKPNLVKEGPEGSSLIKDIKMYNQNGNAITVGFKSDKTEKAIVNIVTLDGRVLASKTIDGTMDDGVSNLVTFDSLQLPSGIYIINVMHGSVKTSQKVSFFR